jgi:hypothetical protein
MPLLNVIVGETSCGLVSRSKKGADSSCVEIAAPKSDLLRRRPTQPMAIWRPEAWPSPGNVSSSASSRSSSRCASAALSGLCRNSVANMSGSLSRLLLDPLTAKRNAQRGDNARRGKGEAAEPLLDFGDGLAGVQSLRTGAGAIQNSVTTVKAERVFELI